LGKLLRLKFRQALGGKRLTDPQGWDWGPAINTSGPWKPIYLQIYEKRIDELLVRQKVSPDLSFAVISVRGSIEHGSLREKVTVNVQSPTGTYLHASSLMASDGRFEVEITVQNPQLWYPHSHGEQPLYKIFVEIPGYDKKTQHIGLRRLQLLQHSLKDTTGTAFVFEINNLRMFLGGSCWIPGDFMLPRLNRESYSDWLRLAKSGNQTMIRVWGGGIVESDDFYDICDQEGILIWQDFLFACGNYPASPDFLRNVEVEARSQLRRVGHHASLVLWAGNNEDYLLADRFGWDIDYSDEKGPWDQTNFPAREIYERLLPRLVEELGGDVPYWRSSPYGGSHSNDPTIGDTHVWDGKLHHLFQVGVPGEWNMGLLILFISSVAWQTICIPGLQSLHFPLYKRVWL
jgi:beta-mannosidase